MKTFEERYTAWIDGQLDGPTLTAFEQELARRSAAGEVEADRTDTLRLRDLLRDHFEAPALSNAEFFSHQLRERINAERTGTGSRTTGSTVGGGMLALFPWSVVRMLAAGAACLFVAGALYYGLEPGRTPDIGGKVAQNAPAVRGSVSQPAAETADHHAAGAPAPDRSGPAQYVMLSTPRPSPLPDETLPDAAPDIQVHDNSSASATGLLYQRPNVNVLWTNGLPYLPDLSSSPAPSPAPGASAAP